ncbi:oligopeptide/dipeptide ABC transporter ATP-binding protein [Prochlorothrix hollandica]|uniref:Peptide ABC transporter ATP-binding protein n=1 Tax=Prochlorothrix hollandica PCC 9006 = CALU 1027 TaxID=317619 RepID=A0A0M2PWZ0_PROHO|nr:ABC transporter ATP-binding protein [Prochlorothrix hollandica]KKI99198.1 peptide ABC transporter ATP-binding protein [Prochlorothrix hollandica PCC 9006 = CALU 1027]
MNPPDLSPPLLQVDNLCKFFPVHHQQLHAVDHVSFRLQAGESVGLVGESGCGKSTLIRLLTRLLNPTAGEITFEGQSLTQIPLDQFPRHPLRAKIQMVFQDATDSLNPRFTAYDTIVEPLKRLGQGPADSGVLRQQAAEISQLVGLPTELLGRYPHQLSGGQKARIGIARAIALHPPLLILDEPTSALDVSVQAVILRLLADLRQRLGMSYLFVSHDLNVVRLLCDRILVMYLGKIVETGPVEAVFQNPRHPYTAALLSAIPSFEAKPHPIPLNGEPRSPINPNPQVCRLYGRCPQGADRCAGEMPLLQEVGPDHWAACHFC